MAEIQSPQPQIDPADAAMHERAAEMAAWFDGRWPAPPGDTEFFQVEGAGDDECAVRTLFQRHDEDNYTYVTIHPAAGSSCQSTGPRSLDIKRDDRELLHYNDIAKVRLGRALGDGAFKLAVALMHWHASSSGEVQGTELLTGLEVWRAADLSNAGSASAMLRLADRRPIPMTHVRSHFDAMQRLLSDRLSLDQASRQWPLSATLRAFGARSLEGLFVPGTQLS